MTEKVMWSLLCFGACAFNSFCFYRLGRTRRDIEILKWLKAEFRHGIPNEALDFIGKLVQFL